MGGGNGQKAKMAREKNAEKMKAAAKGSQLETNKKAMSIQGATSVATPAVPLPAEEAPHASAPPADAAPPAAPVPADASLPASPPSADVALPNAALPASRPPADATPPTSPSPAHAAPPVAPVPADAALPASPPPADAALPNAALPASRPPADATPPTSPSPAHAAPPTPPSPRCIITRSCAKLEQPSMAKRKSAPPKVDATPPRSLPPADAPAKSPRLSTTRSHGTLNPTSVSDASPMHKRTRRKLKQDDSTFDMPPSPTRIITRSCAKSEQAPMAKRKSSCRQKRSDGDPDSLLESVDEQAQEESSDEHPPPPNDLNNDNGSMRCRLQHTVISLRCIVEALLAAGVELDAEDVQNVVKNKRVRNKMKEEPRCGRGLGRPRDPAPPSGRPQLKVVGDLLFAPCITTNPQLETTSTQIKTTIRLLTLENMPGPHRSYNMFPIQSRLNILRKFLQRYTWGPDEDVRRCLDVYENIAADVYGRELQQKRSDCKKLFGEDKEVWKEYPPRWCMNVDNWKGLCDIWLKEKWEHVSRTNRENMLKAGPVIHHVGGSRSMYQHMQSLKSNRGPNEDQNVGMKELFDATHMKDTPSEKIYVNEKAEKLAKTFQDLRPLYGPEVTDEELWSKVVGGEKRGRLLGIGKRSRTSRKNAELQQLQQSTPSTRSTTTTATSQKVLFSRDELDNIVSEKLAAQDIVYSEKLAVQDTMYRARLEELQKVNKYHQECIEKLLQATGTIHPPFDEGPLQRGHAGDANDGGE